MHQQHTNFSLQILLALVCTSFVFAHPQDERSHQVITIHPSVTGGNIILDIYCGPKLSQSFAKALSEAPTLPPESIKSPLSRALAGLQPWLIIKAGNLREVLRLEPAFPKPHPFPLHPDVTPLSKLLEWIDKNPLHRHHLFSQVTPAQKAHMFHPQLRTSGGPLIGHYFHKTEAVPEEPKKELLKVTYLYTWKWPDDGQRKEGVTVSLETILKTFTSNSIFLARKPKEGRMTIDQLNAQGPSIMPEEFLSHSPSKRFKVRKAIFIYEWPKSDSP